MRGLVITSICWAAACATSRGPMPPWVLVAPPYRYEDGGVRREERAPLREWERLGFFDDPDACERFRSEGMAAALNDDEWAVWSLARCFTTDRAGSGLPPDAYD